MPFVEQFHQFLAVQLPRRILPELMFCQLDLGVPRRPRFSNSGIVERFLCTISSRKKRPDVPQNWILSKVQNTQHFPPRREHTIGMKMTQAMDWGGAYPKVDFQLHVLSGITKWIVVCPDVSDQMQNAGLIYMPFVNQSELDGNIGNPGIGGGCMLLAFPPCGFHHLLLLMHKQGKWLVWNAKFLKTRWPQASSKWERKNKLGFCDICQEVRC